MDPAPRSYVLECMLTRDPFEHGVPPTEEEEAAVLEKKMTVFLQKKPKTELCYHCGKVHSGAWDGCYDPSVCGMCDPKGQFKWNPSIVGKEARKAIHVCKRCEISLCGDCAEQCIVCKQWVCEITCGWWDGTSDDPREDDDTDYHSDDYYIDDDDDDNDRSDEFFACRARKCVAQCRKSPAVRPPSMPELEEEEEEEEEEVAPLTEVQAAALIMKSDEEIMTQFEDYMKAKMTNRRSRNTKMIRRVKYTSDGHADFYYG